MANSNDSRPPGVAPTTPSTARKRDGVPAVPESDRLERLVDQLGNNGLANLMAVSRSQPSRWRSGKEGMGPRNRRLLIDLDYVLGRLGQLFTERESEIWLTSHNSHLGARPIDVLRVTGVAPVIAAIDAEAEGAFA